MEIKLQSISIRDLSNGFLDNNENGVVGYGGLLNIRPKYQREFVYNPPQRNAVINTVLKGFPLNVMYWVKNSDGSFEVLDGQQRTISICEYIVGNFSINEMYFHNLTLEEQEDILNYDLMVYFCEGSDKEKLDWFKTINIAGVELSEQELRNAVYTGPWLSDAKKYFSKTNCPAHEIGSKYLSGSAIRQDFLETALCWISHKKDCTIEQYMAINQQSANASELWTYFQNVINWININFITYYKKYMQGLKWGELYNKFKDKELDPIRTNSLIEQLIIDDDVTNKKGIYSFVVSEKESYLNIRQFSLHDKIATHSIQNGKCPRCDENHPSFEVFEMEADHIKPWSKGGKTVIDNCQMLCISHNRSKSNI